MTERLWNEGHPCQTVDCGQPTAQYVALRVVPGVRVCPDNHLSTHHHSHPSPSHVIAAWCQGSHPTDPGCGQLVPLHEFRDRRQDEGPHGSYLIDSRDLPSVLAALDSLTTLDHYWSAQLVEETSARLRAVTARIDP